MKFGVCAPLSRMREAAEAGFDYLEPAVSAVAAMTDAEFAAALAEAERIGLPCLAFNLLFPGELALLGSAADADIASYLRRAMARVRALGGRVAVFGSGRSRTRPEGMTYGEAFRRLAKVARLAGEVAGEYGVTIAIEPLCRVECNMVNSLAEGAAVAAAADHPGVGLTADYYHITRDNEPLSDIARLGNVRHVHIASRNTRRYPLREDGEDFAALFSALRAIGYDGLMSIEGGTDDLAADAPVALALLRRLDGGR